MGFVKVVKNKAYYKRFQVQFRRRRQQKTDYYARKRLIWMDKNKYNAPKYRFVVRFTNRDVVTAVISTDVSGDRVVATAYGHELAKYGVKFGFNNYASSYATGLLCARKVNTKFGLPFAGADEESMQGPYSVAEEDGYDVRPVRAVLDVGLHRTTTGSRIFAALKGALDGGLAIPHSYSRLVGTPKGKDAETDFGLVTKYIHGGHIADYMTSLAEEDEEAFARQFSVAKKNGISGADLEAIYKGVFAKIRGETKESFAAAKRDPLALGYFKKRAAPKDPKAPVFHKGKFWDVKKNGFRFPKTKMHKAQRRARVLERLAKFMKPAAVPAAVAEAAVEESEQSGSDSDN